MPSIQIIKCSLDLHMFCHDSIVQTHFMIIYSPELRNLPIMTSHLFLMLDKVYVEVLDLLERNKVPHYKYFGMYIMTKYNTHFVGADHIVLFHIPPSTNLSHYYFQS